MATGRRGRRISRTTLLLLVPMVPLVLYGVARAAAPASLAGVIFEHPWSYAIVACITIVAGALLMAWRPFEAWAARVLVGARAPSSEERARVEPLLESAGRRAGIDPERPRSVTSSASRPEP